MEAPDSRSSVTISTSRDEYGGALHLDPSSISNKITEEQKAVKLKEFATLLGTKASSKEKGSNFSELVKLLSTNLEDGDVVLIVPSLDLRLSEGDSSLLPDVGEHAKVSDAVTGGSTSDSSSRPNMAASVLTLATEGKANVEQQAAQNIGKQTSWTKSTLRYAAAAVGSNIAESFTQLVNARVRSWTLLLLRHSLSTGDNESRTRLLSMLSAKIRADSTETSFQTLPLPPSAAGKPKEADVILPLLFEAHLHLTIQEKSETVLIRAPGTVSALFSEGGNGSSLKKVVVWLDTGVVLSSLIDQARIVVLKAVATATKTPVGSLQPSTKMAASSGQQSSTFERINEESSSSIGSESLATLRSSLNLSPLDADSSPRLQKAHASALKLNSVLQGNSSITKAPTATTGLRKVRSVKWEEPFQAPKLGPSLAPNPKKLRLVETACKLKSFKSFGRPHGGDFGSGPKNATFGAFGGAGSAGVWGRDGRLAHHPTPMFQTNAQSDQIGLTGVADRNATFDLLKPKQAAHSQNLFNNVLRSNLNGVPGKSSGSTPSLPRTTTALESSLLKRWT